MSKRTLDSAQYEILLKDGFTRVLGQMETRLDAFEKKIANTNLKNAKSADTWAMSMRNAFSVMTGITGATALMQVADSIKDLTMWSLELQSSWEQTNVAFSTMLGSAARSRRILKDLSVFAEITPFTSGEVIGGSRQMLAYGFEAEGLTQDMRVLGDVAAGLSLRLDDLVYVYGTLRTQGRAYARDLFQFALRGIPIYDALSATMGKSTAEIKEMTSEGAVGFKEVEEAFKYMTREGSMFGGMMEKQAQTLHGRWSTLKDKIEFMSREEGVLHYFLKEAVELGIAVLPDLTHAGERFLQTQEKFAKGQSHLINLKDEYTRLSEKVTLNKDEHTRLRDVMQEIARLSPSAVTRWDEYGRAVEVSTDKLREHLMYRERERVEERRKAIKRYEKEIRVARNQIFMDVAAIEGREFNPRGNRILLSDKEKQKRVEDMEATRLDLKEMEFEYASLLRMAGDSTYRSKISPENLSEFDKREKERIEKEEPKGTPNPDPETGIGLEKIQSSTRNIKIDINQLVGEMTFESFEGDEREMTRKVSRALIQAINDVNIIT